MNSVTEPVIKQSRHNGNIRSPKDWLDALASGACDKSQFIRGVGDLVRKGPDAGWELLGLADQYYRRGKISAQTFGSLKTHLQGLLVGTGTSDEVSSPLPRMQGEPPLPAAPAPRAAPASAAASIARVPSSPSRIAPAAADSRLAVAAAHGVAPAAAPAPAVAHGVAPAAAPAPTVAHGVAPAAAPAPTVAHGVAGAPAPAPGSNQRALAAGDVLRGRYLVQGLLGQGGMGTVYAAIDQFRLDRSNSDQKVALKVLHTEVIKRPRLFAELRREFQHLQSLSHPNIVRVHEFDRDGDLAFFTMEYLSGAMLSRVLSAQESSALHRPYALAIIRDVGAAVAHAHARGVVHGDLNAGNIFITDNGEVRVLDFGASHQLHRGPWISEFDNQRQIAVATPRFASCQVLEGEAADARDDVYALACIAYVLLTGDNPFQDNTALKARSLGRTPARPRGLNQRQWNALRAGLNFDRERRPSDMQAWLDRLDLRMAAPHLPELRSFWTVRPRRRGSRKWGIAAAMTAVIVAGGWWVAVNVDSVNVDSLARAGATVSAGMETMLSQVTQFAHRFAGVWDKGLGLSRKPEPVIEAPADLGAPADATSEQPTTEAPMPEPRTPDTTPLIRPVSPARIVGAVSDKLTMPAPRASMAAAAPPLGASAASAATAVPGVTTVQAGTPAPARIELAADNVDVVPTEPTANIVVRRSRNLRGDISFSWWTESGTAKPGRDFVPVKHEVDHIDNGQSSISLTIPVVLDPGRHQSRSFYVVIDQPSDNATLGSRTLAMVTLPGSDPEPSPLPGG
jgi:Protein kinase domain/Calx-beta domain